MYPGERATGTRDEHYGLVSVLYHALHGAENCEVYATDAEAAGRDDLAAFFREAQGAHVGLAERAKGLLGILESTPDTELAPGGGTRSGAEVPPERMVRSEIPPDDVGKEAVPPDAPRTPEPPPRTGDFPPSPSEQPSSEDPRPGP
jgi:hypothetical protein